MVDVVHFMKYEEGFHLAPSFLWTPQDPDSSLRVRKQ